MKVYTLRRTQTLPVSLSSSWDFFSDPRNLQEITPSGLNFRILRVTEAGKVYQGQMIEYLVRILPGVTVRWVTEITAVKDQEYFIDDQRIGPYKLWHHQHHFREVPGGVEMTDAVTYALPFGWVGRLAHRLFVAGQLKAIFEHRCKVLEKKFLNP